jgi:hypothetical protein
MRNTQLLPILAIDILTGAFFGILKANTATTEIIPLFITCVLYALLGVVSVIGLITLPKYEFLIFFSKILIFYLVIGSQPL